MFYILAYHRISNNSGVSPLRDDLVSCSPEVFDIQMSICQKEFTLINFSTLYGYLEKKIELSAPSLVVTFDDGYKENYQYALPILEKYKIPAVFFITTSYVGKRGLFWWDKVAYAFKTSGKVQVEIEVAGEVLRFTLASKEQRLNAERRLLTKLKEIGNEERVAVIDRLPELTGTEENSEEWTLNWEEIREMSEKGMEFGSHTVTHPILTKITDDELLWELKESKRVIEEKTGKEVIAFAYPNGKQEDFYTRIITAVKKIGYKFGVSYIEGVNDIRECDKFALKRIGLDGVSLRRFKLKLGLNN